MRELALKIFPLLFKRYFAIHPNAHPDCMNCAGRGYVKGEHCTDCVNVEVPPYEELGVGD